MLILDKAFSPIVFGTKDNNIDEVPYFDDISFVFDEYGKQAFNASSIDQPFNFDKMVVDVLQENISVDQPSDFDKMGTGVLVENISVDQASKQNTMVAGVSNDNVLDVDKPLEYTPSIIHNRLQINEVDVNNQSLLSDRLDSVIEKLVVLTQQITESNNISREISNKLNVFMGSRKAE